MIIESKNRDQDSADLVVSTISLIDLAGSESSQAHGPKTSKHRAREMSYINRVTFT